MSKTSFEDVAKKLALTKMNTERVIELLKHDILLSAYRKDPRDDFDRQMNEKVKQVFKDWYDADFSMTENQKVLSMFSMGPPGQGKTTSFKVASKEVADALGLKFVINPSDDYQATRKEFLFVSLECSGENSSATFGGIPAKVEEIGPDGEKIVYMRKLPNKRLALLSHVAAGLLLLDDFSNAAPNVQNVALSITDEKRFQGLNLEHCYVGLTGNLGALDGTHTSKISTALRGRTVAVFTTDELPKFIQRTLETYKDDIGDAGIIGFLQRNNEYFAEMPDSKEDGGYPSPRTWEHFIQSARSFIVRGGGRGRGELKAYENIRDYASIILGPQVGLKLAAYYHSLIQGVDPIARAAIVDGKLDMNQLKDKYGNGLSQPQQDFGYQFAMACSDYAVNEISKEVTKGRERNEDAKKALEKTIQRWGRAVLTLNPPEFAYSVDYLKAKMAIQIGDFANATNDKSARKTLKTDVKETICKILEKQEDFDSDKRRVLINAITDYDKVIESRKSSRSMKR
jgi:predicted DNA-binding protein YlxM (UPF0122 family)